MSDPTTVDGAPEVETLVRRLWTEALDYTDTDPDDDWFVEGGDSLGCVRLVGDLERLGLRVDLRAFIASPTLGALVRLCRRKAGTEQAWALDMGNAGDLPLTPAQHRAVEEDGPTRNWHNDHLTLRLCHHATDAAVVRMLAVVARRHPALSARFSRQPGRGWRQVIPPARGRSIPVVRLPSRGTGPPSELATEVHRLGSNFDIELGPTCAAIIWGPVAAPSAVTMVMHHLCMDAISLGILQRTMVDALHQRDVDGPEDGYAPWLAALDRRLSRPQGALGALTSDAIDRARAVELIEQHLEVDARGLAMAQIQTEMITRMAASLARGENSRPHGIDVVVHGRSSISGYPSIASSVGWFSRIRPVETAAPVPAQDLDAPEDYLSELDGRPASALYLNFRGTMVDRLSQPIGDCSPMTLDLGPQSAPEATTGYHVRCVADLSSTGTLRILLRTRTRSPMAISALAALGTWSSLPNLGAVT